MGWWGGGETPGDTTRMVRSSVVSSLAATRVVSLGPTLNTVAICGTPSGGISTRSKSKRLCYGRGVDTHWGKFEGYRCRRRR